MCMCLWCWHEGLSQIGVWDVLDGGHMMGMELVEFPSATNGRGVLSMVIACVGRTMGKEL